MKCVVIANTAGGVGKTTTAHAIAVAAAEYGKKVLLVDADPAGTLTFCCGVENPRVTTLEFLSGSFSLEASAIKSAERFSFLPSSPRLSSLDIDASLDYNALRKQWEMFDLVVVDTATGPNRLMTYFLGAADLIISPSTADIISIRGVLHTKNFVEAVGNSNSLRVLLSGTYDSESELVSQLRNDFTVLEPNIHRDNSVALSQLTGKSVLTEDKNSRVAADYREITYSLLEEFSLI
jgi:cellulose biosynthesis protein BcsQ